eukprot:NODE_656_length_5493_cov_0.311828.p6 type:complete len:102 gc:universal NODE_656_length_5493_cov_0.311828:3928-3623(-)
MRLVLDYFFSFHAVENRYNFKQILLANHILCLMNLNYKFSTQFWSRVPLNIWHKNFYFFVLVKINFKMHGPALIFVTFLCCGLSGSYINITNFGLKNVKFY